MFKKFSSYRSNARRAARFVRLHSFKPAGARIKGNITEAYKSPDSVSIIVVLRVATLLQVEFTNRMSVSNCPCSYRYLRGLYASEVRENVNSAEMSTLLRYELRNFKEL